MPRLIPISAICIFFIINTSQASIASIASFFSNGSEYYPSGNYVGFAIGLFNYNTKWSYAHQSEKVTTNYLPVHNHSKTEAVLFLENRSFLRFRSVHLDVRGEIHYGFYGHAEQQYLVDSIPKISTGGTDIGGTAVFKFAYPFEITPRIRLAYYLGPAIVFTLLEPDGEGISDKYTEAPLNIFNYANGWSEFLLFVPLVAGISLEFETFCIMPEVRYLMVGEAFTDWTPESGSRENVDMGFWSVGLNIGFRMGM